MNPLLSIVDIELHHVESRTLMMIDAEFFEPLIGLKRLSLRRMTNMFLDNMSLLKLEMLESLDLQYFATNSTLTRFLLKNKPNLVEVTIRGFNDEIINFNRLFTRYPLPRLETLVLEQDRIEFLNLTNFGALKRLSLKNNVLRDVRLPSNSQLEVVDLSFNFLTGLNISNAASLKTLTIGHNENSQLDIGTVFANAPVLESFVADEGFFIRGVLF